MIHPVGLHGQIDAIDMRLVRPNGRMVESVLLSRDLRLDTLDVSIAPGESIREVLSRNDVVPGPTALSMVAGLNPELTSLDHIQAGGQLKSIRAAGVEEGYSVDVRITAEVRSRFEATALAAASRLAMWEAGVPPSEHRSELFAATSQILASFEGLHTRLDRIPPDVAAELPARMQNFQDELSALAVTGSPVEEAFVTRAARFANDLEAQNQCARKGYAGCLVRWSVRTMRGSTPVPNLTVWYIGEFERGGRRLGRSSPATRAIMEADYYFWATDDAGRLVTPKVAEPVRRCTVAEDCQLTLPVLPPQ